MGFGAYMADNNWNDHLNIGRRCLHLPHLFPSRYLHTVDVATGFFNGYRSEAGTEPEGFHFLDLGAPIMMPLVTACAWGTPHVTFDATSPIKDALFGGTLYVTKPAYLKIRTWKIAQRMASQQRATRSRSSLMTRVDNIVEAYANNTNSERYMHAIRFSRSLAMGVYT